MFRFTFVSFNNKYRVILCCFQNSDFNEIYVLKYTIVLCLNRIATKPIIECKADNETQNCVHVFVLNIENKCTYGQTTHTVSNQNYINLPATNRDKSYFIQFITFFSFWCPLLSVYPHKCLTNRLFACINRIFFCNSWKNSLDTSVQSFLERFVSICFYSIETEDKNTFIFQDIKEPERGGLKLIYLGKLRTIKKSVNS